MTTAPPNVQPQIPSRTSGTIIQLSTARSGSPTISRHIGPSMAKANPTINLIHFRFPCREGLTAAKFGSYVVRRFAIRPRQRSKVASVAPNRVAASPKYSTVQQAAAISPAVGSPGIDISGATRPVARSVPYAGVPIITYRPQGSGVKKKHQHFVGLAAPDRQGQGQRAAQDGAGNRRQERGDQCFGDNPAEQARQGRDRHDAGDQA
jgi:hypothetical protein